MSCCREKYSFNPFMGGHKQDFSKSAFQGCGSYLMQSSSQANDLFIYQWLVIEPHSQTPPSLIPRIPLVSFPESPSLVPRLPQSCSQNPLISFQTPLVSFPDPFPDHQQDPQQQCMYHTEGLGTRLKLSISTCKQINSYLKARWDPGTRLWW